MQAPWKACFLLPLLFHRECATTIDGGLNDVPAHIVEERSQESSVDPKLAALFGVASATLVLGTKLIGEIPNLGKNLQNINWTRVQGDTSEKPPSLTQIFDKFGNTILKQVNCNVIVADWRNGSEGPNYARAAANTPMAGVMISLLLEKIIKATNCTLHPDNVTLIGFSLGAHVVGFAGRHFHRNTSMLLGRITGLDPAGMLFEDTNVSLSRHDAKFVDVIHTNMGDIKTLQLGLPGTQGHVDFYPNGGDYQPGCSKHPNISIFSLLNASSLNGALLSVMESVACSHYRAPEMFTESLTNHDCTFTSYPCPGGWKNFTECKKEFEKNETVKGLMGYYSYTKKGRGKQYLQTNGKPPYCNNSVSGEAAVC